MKISHTLALHIISLCDLAWGCQQCFCLSNRHMSACIPHM